MERIISNSHLADSSVKSSAGLQDAQINFLDSTVPTHTHTHKHVWLVERHHKLVVFPRTVLRRISPVQMVGQTNVSAISLTVRAGLTIRGGTNVRRGPFLIRVARIFSVWGALLHFSSPKKFTFFSYRYLTYVQTSTHGVVKNRQLIGGP